MHCAPSAVIPQRGWCTEGWLCDLRTAALLEHDQVAASYDRGVITGIHAIVFSPEAEKVRAFFADILGMPSADAGGGWPIFALPPAELAVHPADGDSHHELYLMCDNIQVALTELRGKGVEVAREVSDQGWGLLAAVRLPDGSEFPIYEPRHPSPSRP